VKLIAAVMLGFFLIWLSGCTATSPTRYPISGEPCAPDDPVHDLRADMIPPI
jgi:hypothetical protein